MPTCRSCGQENPENAKFCLNCAASLIDLPTRGGEERKVVTVLFCDLVGFTSRSEGADVEEVRSMLVPYHALLKRELERHGGTVEKFIGDAVMALFGAPVAHEDDPERAVRAALAILDAVRDLPDSGEPLDLHVRIGVNTGEALIALDADPAAGEGMASGDVVNTAARLEAAAPVDGVLVGEVTYLSTTGAIEYERAASIDAKGKAERVPAWVVRGARSRLGSDIEQRSDAPMIGRERELASLVATLDQVREEGSAQLTTVIGMPGIGKSRLLWEFFTHVDGLPELITWRQGRSLPYGEGVALWALGEIFKAQAGILDSDTVPVATEKVTAMVGSLINEDRETAWLLGHLRPLLGLESEEELGGDRQAEAFAAWRRVLEALASERPAVLVFEDIHWADDALLDFIDHLVEWAREVPLLLLCTARPELLDRRSGWAGGKPNAFTISLSPLSGPDTARLIGVLLNQAVLPSETQAALLSRAEGNPLFAQEYVRMLVDRGFLVLEGSTWRLHRGDELPLPESVQGVIAARLDALPAEEKHMIQAAAVVGKVLWAGATAHIAGRGRWAAEELLHGLERKQFLRRERTPSVAGESEYAFQHVLVRDVAYGQIPRAERARKHRLAAEWIESQSADRGDRVELLAHHLLTALELTRATGGDTTDLAEQTIAALRDAGDRALALNAYAAAISFFGSALELSPADPKERAMFLFALGKARYHIEDELPPVLEEAAEALATAGQVEASAEAETMIGVRLANLGRMSEGFARLKRAEALVRETPPSWGRAWVLSSVASGYILTGEDLPKGVVLGNEAVALAGSLGLDEILAEASQFIGIGRLMMDDPGGIADIRASIRASEGLNSPIAVLCNFNNGESLRNLGDLAQSSRLLHEARQKAEQLGSQFWLRAIQGNEIIDHYYVGRWAEARTVADAILAEVEAGAPFLYQSEIRVVRARIHLADDERTSAARLASAAVEWARSLSEPQVFLPSLAIQSRVLAESGDPSGAGEVASEALGHLSSQNLTAWALSDLAIALFALGRPNDLAAAASGLKLRTPWLEAAIALSSGDFHDAADAYAAIGSLPDEAYARQRSGESLLQEGGAAEGNADLERALELWEITGSVGRLASVKALLTKPA